MKIKEIYYKTLEIQLTEPYTIAYDTYSSCNIIFMMCITDKGGYGFGSASPEKNVTGEDIGRSLLLIDNIVIPMLRNSDPFEYARIIEELKKEVSSSPSVMAMVDMLLFDLVAKKAGVPLFKFLGAYRSSIPTSITIGIMPVEDTLEKAREYFQSGFNIFKLKGGLSCDEDIEKIRKLRESFKDKIELRVDANQGYTVDEAIRFVEETRDHHVELLEQPTPRNDYEMLGKVSNLVSIPVMADESILDLKDVFHLTKHDLTDMINIKLMKTGGIVEAMHINSVARAAKVEAMVGCMDESELSVSAGLHFALSRPNIIYADLDGHMDLLNDPAKNTVIIKNGIISPSELPGLGLKNLDRLLKIF